MRRLTRAESEPIVAEARTILKLYRRRLDTVDHKSAGSLMPLIEDLLRRGHLAGGSPNLNSLRLSKMERWLINVTWILQTVGPVSAFVMTAHLARNSRVERTWRRIAADLEAAGIPLLEDEVSELYRAAVPFFVKLLHDREITRDIDDEPRREPRAESLPAAVTDPNVSVQEFIRMLRAA